MKTESQAVNYKPVTEDNGKKFDVQFFSIEKIESRIKELDDEIKRREEKLADTIIAFINKPK
jgi:uncharacterized small protein (DUF1192 family)